MGITKFISTTSVVFLLTSCASIKSFHMPKVEQQLSTAYQSSDEISAKSQNDFNEKKNLQETLAKGKSASYKEIESQLKQKLNSMDQLLKQMNQARRRMSEAKGQVTALGYSKSKIHGGTPEYERVEEHIKDFETAAAEFTATVSKYSLESNSLASLVTQKKLYFNFDVVEFQKKVQKSLSAAETNSKFMSQELERAHKIVESLQGESQTVANALMEEMTVAAEEHNKKAEHLNSLQGQMSNLASGQAKIASTSPDWSDVQKVVHDSERTTLSINELYKEFQNKTDRFRRRSP